MTSERAVIADWNEDLAGLVGKRIREARMIQNEWSGYPAALIVLQDDSEIIMAMDHFAINQVR